MKQIALFLILIALVPRASAQDKEKEATLFSGRITFGGYGGPQLKLADFGDKTAVLVGGKGGLILNRALVIGGGGYGLANDIEVTDLVTRRLEFGYGGLYIEYIAMTTKLVHFTVETLIGGGGVDIADTLDRFGRLHNGESDSFFALEPGAHAELNIAEFMRLAVGATYLFVDGTELSFLDDDDFSGVNASFVLKFGNF